MSNDIQRASMPARIGLVVLSLVLFVLILLASNYAEQAGEWVAEAPRERIVVFALVVCVFSVPLMAYAINTIFYGARAVSEERYPSVGMPVLRDTPVVRGVEARRLGRRLQIGGALVAAMALGFPTTLYVILRRLVDGLQ